MKLIHNDRIMVGCDIGDEYSQISCCRIGEKKAETLSAKMGGDALSIPTLLCKKEGSNQWLYGREALCYAEAGQGILVDRLLGLAADGEEILIEGTAVSPVALLALFLKRLFALLNQVPGGDRIEGIMVTGRIMDARRKKVILQALAMIGIKQEKVFFQEHQESFYDYVLYQPRELMTGEVLLCECDNASMHIYHMVKNAQTIPQAVFVNEQQYSFADSSDEEFLAILQKECRDRKISCVYLLGERFLGEWMKESLKYLCRGKRVFQGNNLYSKGACYGMLERLNLGEAASEYVFLGQDKLKVNVGMKILRRGQESYVALLDAGVGWYEASRELEVYVQEGGALEVVVTSMTEKSSRLVRMTLEELPEGLRRLKMRVFMQDETHLVLEAEDLGLGVFCEPVKRQWKEVMEI